MKYKLVEIILSIINSKKTKAVKKESKISYSNGNKVVVIKMDGTKEINPKIPNFFPNFIGKNNYIEFQEPFKIHNRLSFTAFGDNSIFKCGRNFYPKHIALCTSTNSAILIGSNFSCENVMIVENQADGTKIEIGNDCMISGQIVIRSGDAHAIYDKDTKKLLNPDKDTKIGDHVWIAYGSQILKGSNIPSGCVVGAGSIVNKKFYEENCIIAGNPAKIVKQNVAWDRRSPSSWANLVE